MSFQVAFLNIVLLTVYTLEREDPTMHSDVGLHAEELSIDFSTVFAS